MRSRQAGFFPIEGAALYLVVGLAVALVLTIAGSSAAIWFLDRKLDAANDRAEKAAAALAKEEQSRKGFEAAASACSASVQAMATRARNAEARYNQADGERQGLSKAVQSHIQAVLNRPRPAGMSECEAMKKELDDEIDYRAARK